MNNADLDAQVICPAMGGSPKGFFLRNTMALRECLRLYATEYYRCDGCATGRQRVDTAGPPLMARILDDPCSSPTSPPRTSLGVSAKGNHALFKVLLGGEPHTTAELRQSLTAATGHSRGLTTLLEALRKLNLVFVKTTGTKSAGKRGRGAGSIRP